MSSRSFHAVLSALNPLQYLPVIGTIYRAVTGDEIPEFVRRVGSLVVSTLLGGPIGAGINLAMLAGEKASGIDLDKSGQQLLRGGSQPPPADDPPRPMQQPVPEQAAPQPWSVTQLAAYGVKTDDGGRLQQNELHGAEVLNALELSRLQSARIAYGRVAPPT